MKTYKTPLPEITLKYKSGDQKKVKISKSQDAYLVMKELFDQDTLELTESFIVLFLNRANNTIGWIKVSQGGIAGTVVDIKLIFATALKCAASAMILAHNHPSGNKNPSEADISMTKRLKEGGNIFEIQILDHLIVTEKEYLSMSDEGLI
jgi:DNA repair protein RadC